MKSKVAKIGELGVCSCPYFLQFLFGMTGEVLPSSSQ